MKKSFSVFLLLCSLLLCACSTPKFIQGTDITKIEFGGGGGFTGATTSYILSANGTIRSDEKQYPKLKPNEMKEISALTRELDGEFFHPSNVYYFIYIYRGEIRTQYVWGFGDNIPASVRQLYEKLYTKIR